MATVTNSTTGTTFISGAFSGIDTKALIQQALDAKLAPKDRLDIQISKNTNKITAFQALQSQALSLKGAFDKLKSDVLQSNAFGSKQATYSTSNSSVTPASVLSAETTSFAQPGSHTVIVNNTAKSFSAQGTNQSSITTALGFNGSFDIGLDGKTPATITITDGMTLQDVRNTINAQSAATGVNADLLQVSPGQYRLVLRGADTAKDVNVTNITGDNVLNALGMVDAGGAFLDVTQPAEQASIVLNGTTVTSDSNTFSNVLTGVTIKIANEAPGTTITMNIGNDVSGTKTAIEDMVSKYNALRVTLANYKTIGVDGSIPETSYLYNEGIANKLQQTMRSFVTGTYGAGGAFNGLSSLGITLDANGDLIIDQTKLSASLNNNYDDVRAMFETNGSNRGLGDVASALLDEVANVTTGSIAGAMESLRTINTDLKKKGDDIATRVEAYQLQLINKYAKLETKLKTADTIKKQILAILEGSTPSR